MTDVYRSPQFLVALAHTSDDQEDITKALYEELRTIRPSAAEGVDRTSIPFLVEALTQRAPDGWYFGVKDDAYGFWPADL